MIETIAVSLAGKFAAHMVSSLGENIEADQRELTLRIISDFAEVTAKRILHEKGSPEWAAAERAWHTNKRALLALSLETRKDVERSLTAAIASVTGDIFDFNDH